MERFKGKTQVRAGDRSEGTKGDNHPVGKEVKGITTPSPSVPPLLNQEGSFERANFLPLSLD
jgi:hypothetical protein